MKASAHARGVETVGEPCAGEPHARFDEGRLGRCLPMGPDGVRPSGKPLDRARRSPGARRTSRLLYSWWSSVGFATSLRRQSDVASSIPFPNSTWMPTMTTRHHSFGPQPLTRFSKRFAAGA
jgi:hypothetical protein